MISNFSQCLKRCEDCGCLMVGFLLHTVGCKIDPDEKPPKGYRCNCRFNLFDCSGSAIPCSDSDGKGCSGCAEKECCSDEGWNGECNGYDKIKWWMEQI